MAKLLSVQVTDELYNRVVTQQQKLQFMRLSPFLRKLIVSGLTVLEHNAPHDDQRCR